MMRVVNSATKSVIVSCNIGESSKSPFVLGNKPEPRPEIKKGCWRRGYDEVAIDEERGERRSGGLTRGSFISFSISFVPPGWRHVDVIRAGLLQREAHEFTAAGECRPVIELYGMKVPFLCQHSSLFAGRVFLARLKETYSRAIRSDSQGTNILRRGENQ